MSISQLYPRFSDDWSTTHPSSTEGEEQSEEDAAPLTVEDEVEALAGPAQSGQGPISKDNTTAMLRNIPNKYTQAMLVAKLQESFKTEIDFLYLPIDFKNRCNVGYAFLNFRTAEACQRFASEYHLVDSRKKLPGFNSKKVCEVSSARVQGCDENVRRIQNSPVLVELLKHTEWLPVLFAEDGSPKAFPVPRDKDLQQQAARPVRGGRLGRHNTASAR
jgi:hypothetical protein